MKIKEKGLKLSRYSFWGHSPIQIESYEKKENLTMNDIMSLRYFAMEFLSENIGNLTRDDIEDEASMQNNSLCLGYLTRDDIEDTSSMQNNSLYLGNFEGYYLEDYDLYIHAIEMTTENKIILCCYLDDKPIYFLGY